MIIVIQENAFWKCRLQIVDFLLMVPCESNLGHPREILFVYTTMVLTRVPIQIAQQRIANFGLTSLLSTWSNYNPSTDK